METALQEPVWAGFDRGRADCIGRCFTFICGDCERTHQSLFDRIPKGWDLQPGTGGHAPAVRCPDCMERIEQAELARRQAQTFTLFLEKQEGGHFQIAMMPEDVLMRWLPLGFYLTPEQARALAVQLVAHATLAENPGAVPGEIGGAK